MALTLDAARAAIRDRIATPLGISVDEAACGIHAIVNETMAGAARAHQLERGKAHPPCPCSPLAGAGPVHGYRVAQAFGSPRLLVPLGAGIMSTVGFLSAPISFDFVRPWRSELSTVDWPHALDLLAQMTGEGHALLAQAGLSADDLRAEWTVDMRYVG
jgi:N-methylhydantoinase A